MAKTNGVSRPFWVQMTACGFAAVLASSLSIGALGSYRQYNQAENAIRVTTQDQIKIILTDIEAARRIASTLALQIATEPGLGSLIQAAERESIVARFGHDFSRVTAAGGPNVAVITDAHSAVVARLHDPESSGDSIGDRPMVVDALAQAAFTSGNELGRAGLGVYALAPVVEGSKLVGLVDAGLTLSNTYFEQFKKTMGVEVAVEVIRGTHFVTQNTTLPGSTMLSPAELAMVSTGGSVRHAMVVGHKVYSASGAPIRDFKGVTIGVLEVATDVTAAVLARRDALYSTAAIIAAVCLLTLLGFLIVTRRLGSVVARLTMSVGRVAAGDLETVVVGVARSDEVGAMARAVVILQESAVARRQLEQEALAVRNAVEEAARRNEAERAELAAQQSAVVQTLAGGLARLAEGDLTCELQQPFPPAYECLRSDFNAAATQLRTAVSAIAANTDAVHASAGEISSANDDLSRRTEQQAATLEQTAAALDQITATVTRTAQGAAESAAIVQDARSDAEHSGEVVHNAIAAMSAIEQSSRQIGSIIGTIDEIAFQTSLLALNAGVEAARAGESGRGFAVVASEVRALAQRSASAAKEIKVLVVASSTQVARGVALVGETGGALDAMVAKITRAATALSGIVTSAQEQATGLQQVNTGVNQMDQVTQQNAAMVEQTTAASHALRQQAETLTALTGEFRTQTDRPSDAAAHMASRPNFKQAGPSVVARSSSPSRALPVKRHNAATPGAATIPSRTHAAAGQQSRNDDGWEEF